MSNIGMWKRHQQVIEVPNPDFRGGVIRDLYDLIRNAEGYAKENGISTDYDDYARWEADDESLRVVFDIQPTPENRQVP